MIKKFKENIKFVFDLWFLSVFGAVDLLMVFWASGAGNDLVFEDQQVGRLEDRLKRRPELWNCGGACLCINTKNQTNKKLKQTQQKKFNFPFGLLKF